MSTEWNVETLMQIFALRPDLLEEFDRRRASLPAAPVEAATPSDHTAAHQCPACGYEFVDLVLYDTNLALHRLRKSLAALSPPAVPNDAEAQRQGRGGESLPQGLGSRAEGSTPSCITSPAPAAPSAPLAEAAKALQELVALKDLRAILDRGTCGDPKSERDREWRRAHDEYYARKSNAWTAARAVCAALATQPADHQGEQG